jgi:hypothetical protein
MTDDQSFTEKYPIQKLCAQTNTVESIQGKFKDACENTRLWIASQRHSTTF